VRDIDTQTSLIGTHYFGAMNPQQSSRRQNRTIAIGPIVNVTPPAKVQPAGIVMVSGNWSLKLGDNRSSSSADLTLSQNGNIVYGTGNIDRGSNITLQAAAMGMVTDRRLSLDLVTLGDVSLYRLSLAIRNHSVTGRYSAFIPKASKITGVAKGERL
jgi:hypothetical protein